jgi:hypothetical protein
MKYASEMGSGAMICIPSCIKTGSGIKKLAGRGSYRYRQHRDGISLLSFLKNEERSLKVHGI